MLRCLSLVIILFLGYAQVWGTSPIINIVYPKSGDTLAAVDSCFILGSVTPGARLTINGQPIEVHAAGGFLGFLPIKQGAFTFNLKAIAGNDTTTLDWPVQVGPIQSGETYDSLFIINGYPEGDSVYISSGERLRISFRGTPGCRAWCRIPGQIDSIPMIEANRESNVGSTGSAFGQVSSINTKQGLYEGFYDLPCAMFSDSLYLTYFLKAPEVGFVLEYLINKKSQLIDYNYIKLLQLDGRVITANSPYRVYLNSPEFPRLVEFADSVQTLRVAPQKGYLAIFQPKGIKALAVGREGDWLKLQLSPYQFGWVNKNSVRFLAPGTPPPISYLKAIRTFSFADKLEVNISLASRHAYRFEEEDDRTLCLYLYGVISDTDWIRYAFDDPDLDYITWSQPEPELYCLRMTFQSPIWGYEFDYDGNILKGTFFRAPEEIKKLKGKKIVIDPGHSPDAGAIGPTGLTEAEANLAIALNLAEKLRGKGAEVVVTRSDASPLPLYNRPQIARAARADLFVSIHNNALPEGINPFVNNGVSVYYYHLHSKKLAEAIQRELIRETGLPDFGLYHGNLAVNRPTQYPAVLVECAFMIIPEQEALLKTEAFRNKLAVAITRGIAEFFGKYDRNK